MNKDYIDSPSNRIEYQESVVLGFVESFCITLEAILHSPEVMEVTFGNTPMRQDVLLQTVNAAFHDVEKKYDFRQEELNQFHDLRERVFQSRKPLSSD